MPPVTSAGVIRSVKVISFMPGTTPSWREAMHSTLTQSLNRSPLSAWTFASSGTSL